MKKLLKKVKRYYSKADIDGLREILKYTEVLECAVKACRGEKCN